MQNLKSLPIKKVSAGLAVGFANGLFGGGGGMLAVPFLRQSGYAEKSAHATAILVILPVSLFSFFLYFFKGGFSANVAIPTAIGVTAGGVLGAKFLQVLPEKKVRLCFAVLQFFAGVYMFFF